MLFKYFYNSVYLYNFSNIYSLRHLTKFSKEVTPSI